MIKSRLTILLSSLNPLEFKYLYKYLKASFVTQTKDVLKLANYLRKFYPAFDNQNLERQLVYEFLYPTANYNGPKLRNLLSRLTKIIEDYLIYLELQQEDFEKKILLAKIFSKRNLSVELLKKTQEAIDELENQPYRGSNFYYNNYHLQSRYYLNQNTSKQKKNLKFLQNAIENLDCFYHLERLRLGLELINRAQIFAEVQESFSCPSTNIFPNNLTYTILYELHTMHSQEDKGNFTEIINLYTQNFNNISIGDRQIIHPFLLNYTMQQFPRKESTYLVITYDIFKLGIESKVLLPNNKISANTYLNFVIVGSKLKKFDYVKQFIKEYKSCLIEHSNKETMELLATSHLFFNQNKYEEVLDLLQVIQLNCPLLKLSTRILLIRNYFHLFEMNASYFSVLIAQINAFEKYLQRDTFFCEKKKLAFYNFIILIKKITNIRYSKNRTSRIKQKLDSNLNSQQFVVARSWLQNIINRL